MSKEEDKMMEYCKTYNIHHLLELLASRVLVERPENPFQFLRELLSSVEESEGKKQIYDPTEIRFTSSLSTEKAISTRDDPSQSGESIEEKKRRSPGIPAETRKLTIAVLGIENAGKTSLISALGGEITTLTVPTVGFAPVHFYTEEEDICLFDLGGAANFREVWVHYYADCHAVVYVIDSASDEASLNESLAVLKGVLSHPHIQGKPVLLIANKTDLKSSRLGNVLPKGFLEDLPTKCSSFRITPTCSIAEDEERDEGMDWLIGTVTSQYDVLSARVRDDVAAEKEKKRKEREARRAAMLAEES